MKSSYLSFFSSESAETAKFKGISNSCNKVFTLNYFQSGRGDNICSIDNNILLDCSASSTEE
jgi:hypothetical protein